MLKLCLIPVMIVGSCGASFVWGLATLKYQIFPFSLIRAVTGGSHAPPPNALDQRSPYHIGKIKLFDAMTIKHRLRFAQRIG